MLNYFACGAFRREEKEDEECLKNNSDSSPRKAKKNKKHGKARKKDNPYATRGLDKFAEVLADLNEKRQKIYSQMNPQDVSLVRFVYSGTQDFVPLVVKVKNKNDVVQRKHKSEELVVKRVTIDNNNNNNNPPTAIESSEDSGKRLGLESVGKKAEKMIKRKLSWDSWRRPYYYLPVVMILILVLLTVVGRSAATLCICIVWYIVPTLQDSSKPIRNSMKKKDYVRGLSEKKKIASDNHRGASSKDNSPRKHGHQRS